MTKLLLSLLILTFILVGASSRVHANDYVMPYPGFMPGHPLYKISEVTDTLQEWWMFGNLAKFKHHLGVADKKLIEAKTLMEYKQYLLGVNAIEAYEVHLRSANVFLGQAQSEGKDVSEKRIIFKSAIEKHRNILEVLKNEQPKEFVWQPEKDEAKRIEISSTLERAILLGSECGKE